MHRNRVDANMPVGSCLSQFDSVAASSPHARPAGKLSSRLREWNLSGPRPGEPEGDPRGRGEGPRPLTLFGCNPQAGRENLRLDYGHSSPHAVFESWERERFRYYIRGIALNTCHFVSRRGGGGEWGEKAGRVVVARFYFYGGLRHFFGWWGFCSRRRRGGEPAHRVAG